MNIVKHSASFEITQPIGVLSPLFSAEGKMSWVPCWDYIKVMGNNDLHEDNVLRVLYFGRNCMNKIDDYQGYLN